MDQRYCIVRDSDGHYWLCPVERRKEAVASIEAIERYWETGGAGSGKVPEHPDYLKAIDGPHTLTFTDPREDG